MFIGFFEIKIHNFIRIMSLNFRSVIVYKKTLSIMEIIFNCFYFHIIVTPIFTDNSLFVPTKQLSM